MDTDTWTILTKELSYYGIRLINENKCQIYLPEKGIKTQGVFKTIRQLNKVIKKHIKIYSILWNDAIFLLNEENVFNNLNDDKMSDLFIFALKDMAKLLLCFNQLDKSPYALVIESALNRDINSFTREQITKLPDYKISLDWTHRLINRLSYIKNLLVIVLTGKQNVNQCDTVKLAKGIAGPWSRLDLPTAERVFPFGNTLYERMKDKQHQLRYRQGFDDYNGDGRVSEGHYWRELRNEPFLWSDRATESPYPSRFIFR